MARKFGVFVFAFILIAGRIGTAQAAEGGFPAKPIEIVCAYSAGSSIDIMCRLVADLSQKYFKQSVIVVNKPGAAGSVAAGEVISSKSGGYKLLALGHSYFSTIVKGQKIPFNPNDLVPVATFMEYKSGLAIRGDAPWKTLNDLLDYGKKNQGKLRWVHIGHGSLYHMMGLLIFRKAGIQTVDIPGKGSPENLASLLGGHVDAAVITYGGVKDHVKAGKIRYLMMFTDKRYSDPANILPATEMGYPEVARLNIINGFFAHKDTPQNIRQTLLNTFQKVYEEPEFKKGIERLGEEPVFLGPGAITEAIKKQEEVAVPLLKELGLYKGK